MGNCTLPNKKLYSEYLNIYPDLPEGYGASWAIEYCEIQEPKIIMVDIQQLHGYIYDWDRMS